MNRLLPLVLLAASSAAHAIVIRDDVSDARYRIAPDEFPALVDMPGEGHGVLIAPQWVITAAHVLPRHAGAMQVVINGEPRDVERVAVHPGYKTPPQAMIDQALATGEAVLLLALLSTSDDIALVRLAEPVTDVEPVALYTAGDEAGQVVKLVGKGATGTGAEGHSPDGPNRTALRRAFNTVTSAHERWFCYVFDAPSSSLPLEGALGNGDSGGAVLIEVDAEWRLAGLGAWKLVYGDIRTARPGRYGQPTCNVRMSHYSDWIERVLAEPTSSSAGG